MDVNRLIEIFNKFLEATFKTARERKLTSYYREMRKGVAEAFREQGKIVMAEMPSLKKHFGEANVPGGDDIDRILEQAFAATLEILSAPINKGIRDSLEAGGLESVTSFGLELSFNLDHPAATEYLNKHGAEMVSQINETTRSTIKKIVTDGIAQGKSYDNMAEEIQERFETFAEGRPQHHIDSRAHHVAITETGNAFEHGNNLGAQQLKEMGVQMEKKWVTVGDNKVSDGCATNEAEGWIDIDANHNSGDQHPLRFPGCRCHEQYRRKPQDAEE